MTTVRIPIARHPLRTQWLRHAAGRRLRQHDARRYQLATKPMKTKPGQWHWRVVKGHHARALDAFRRWGLITEHGRITRLGLLVLATWEMK